MNRLHTPTQHGHLVSRVVGARPAVDAIAMPKATITRFGYEPSHLTNEPTNQWDGGQCLDSKREQRTLIT